MPRFPEEHEATQDVRGPVLLTFAVGFFPVPQCWLYSYTPPLSPKVELFNVKSPQKSSCLGDMWLQAKSSKRGSPSQGGRLIWAGEKDGRKVRVRRES